MCLEALMKREKETKSVELDEKQIVSFKESYDVFVTSGKLWITVDGDSEDYIYGEGESFKIPTGKHTVIQALGKSSFWF